MIRPSATYGHLGDVVGDKLIYDAPTAHGGSGGPVFNSQAEVIGINNRDLRTFTVDRELAARLRPSVPADRIVVAESGIRNADDVARLLRVVEQLATRAA